MVDVAGHLGMALLWLAPAWFLVTPDRTAATVVGVGFWFGALPDVDLYLRRVVPTVRHHGVLHTVLGVTLLAAVIGPALGRLLQYAVGDTDWFRVASRRRAAWLGFLAVWISGLSHVFADMLSAPDIAQAVEPFWPLYQGTVGLDLVWYNAAWFNWGLLLAGVALNVAFALGAAAADRRRRRDGLT